MAVSKCRVCASSSLLIFSFVLGNGCGKNTSAPSEQSEQKAATQESLEDVEKKQQLAAALCRNIDSRVRMLIMQGGVRSNPYDKETDALVRQLGAIGIPALPEINVGIDTFHDKIAVEVLSSRNGLTHYHYAQVRQCLVDARDIVISGKTKADERREKGAISR